MKSGVIAAVRTEEDFAAALRSAVHSVFLLRSHILTLDEYVSRARQANKKLYVHVDMADGIGKDRAGIEYLARRGVGVITTKSNLIVCAREAGLDTVQRFFIIDSMSVRSAAEAVRSARPDTAELMPGLKEVITRMAGSVKIPVIAGGLVSDARSLAEAFAAGAFAVSTSERSLWTK